MRAGKKIANISKELFIVVFAKPVKRCGSYIWIVGSGSERREDEFEPPESWTLCKTEGKLAC